VKIFYQSAWTEGEWPDFSHGKNVLQHTQHALHLLFSLFYGAQITTEYVSSLKTNELADETFDIVCAAYAYAEYLLCDTKIKQKILKVLQSHPDYWQAVTEDPKRHIMFAIRLQNHEIYYGALRHLVNHAYSSVHEEVSWSHVAQAMGSDVGVVQKFFEPQLQKLEKAAARLHQDLLALSTSAEQRKIPEPAIAGLKPSQAQRAERNVKNQKAALIATDELWQDWLKGTHYGKKIVGTGADQKSNDLNYKVRIMNEARYSTTSASVHVFGHFSSAYLCSTFPDNPKPEGCEGLLRLKERLREADHLISAAIPPYSYKSNEIHPILGECLYGSSQFGEHRDGYFTNINLPIHVPWDNKQAREQRMVVEEVEEEVDEIDVLWVDMRDASKEWFGAVAVALGELNSEELASMLEGLSLA
jgi:hypothetical protein